MYPFRQKSELDLGGHKDVVPTCNEVLTGRKRSRVDYGSYFYVILFYCSPGQRKLLSGSMFLDFWGHLSVSGHLFGVTIP